MGDGALRSREREREGDRKEDGGEQEGTAARPAPGARTAASGAEEAPEQSLGATLDKIQNAYHSLGARQVAAVRHLLNYVKDGEQPPANLSFLETVARVALVGALGAIGKRIELALSGLVKQIAKGIADAGKNTAKKAAANVGELVREGSASPRAFFHGQELALLDASKRQVDRFIDWKDRLQGDPNAEAEAEALHAAVDGSERFAYEQQRARSLDQWCTYLATSAVGGASRTTADGPIVEPFLDRALGDGAEPGVLNLLVKAGEPGDRPEIRTAELEGLNHELWALIEERPLREVRMPKNIQTRLWGADHDFGVQPSGAIAWKRIRARAGDWLSKRAEMNGASGPLEGNRILAEQDVGELSVRGKLRRPVQSPFLPPRGAIRP